MNLEDNRKLARMEMRNFMPTIQLKHVTFGYDSQEKTIFNDTSLKLQTEWKLGLIGRNGRGKTTLLKLLQNELPFKGVIQHEQTFHYFPQTVIDKQQSTYDVLQALCSVDQWKIERELRLLAVDESSLWRPFDTLSGGEQTKVLLAVLFVDEQNYPLIDEPTNHLDQIARQQVVSYLQSKKMGFILVSHDRAFVDEVVDHVLAIEKSQLILYNGNFSVYEEQKAMRDQFEQNQNTKIKKEIGRLKHTAAEKAEWSRSKERDKLGSPKKFGSGGIPDTGAIGARAARTMKRSKAIVKRMEDQANEKEQLLKDIEYVDPLTMQARKTHHRMLVSAEKVQLGYDYPLFQPLSFEIEQGQRFALRGANGSGKTTILAAILGTFSGNLQGNLTIPKGITISTVRQNYEDNRGTLAEFAEENGLVYADLLNNLFKLGVERTVFHTRIEQMSMGQRKRVELAKSLATPAELFIWDEPLNYLDVFNHQQIEQVIQMIQPTMIVVEHDARFIDTIATNVLDVIPVNAFKESER